MPKPESVTFETAVFKSAGFEAATFAPVEAQDDPLAGVLYTGDPEVDSSRELGALEAGFIARAKTEEKRRQKATDSEYWVCLCFQTREQVEAFMRETGWGAETDKYVDGQVVARKLGVEITRDDGFGRTKIDRRLATLALPV